MATYVTADIHGRFDKYRAMLEEISFKDRDTLYVLGDVIDRGPDGVKILQDMMLRPNVFPLLGNHEFIAAMCLPWLLKEITEESLGSLGGIQMTALNDWMTNGGGPTLKALQALSQEEREDILEYLREMQVYEEVEVGGQDFALVHAGIEDFSPQKELEDYPLEAFLFARPDPKMEYFPDRTLIFGHTPTRVLWEMAGKKPRDTIFQGKTFLDIDCACGFDGQLSCLCLDTLEEYYV